MAGRRSAVEVVRLEARHLDELLAHYPSLDRPESREALLDGGYAGLVDGCVVAAAGIVRMWRGRGYGWFLGGEATLREWAAITRAVKRGAQEAGYRRLEAAVDANDTRAQRWAERLGFKREALCRRFMPNGNDAILYAIIRES